MEFVKRVGIVASAALGVVAVATLLSGVVVRWAREPLRSEISERKKADAAIVRSMEHNAGFIALNTQRLDDLGILMTTPVGSPLHRQASADLERLRQRRATMDGIGAPFIEPEP